MGLPHRETAPWASSSCGGKKVTAPGAASCKEARSPLSRLGWTGRDPMVLIYIHVPLSPGVQGFLGGFATTPPISSSRSALSMTTGLVLGRSGKSMRETDLNSLLSSQRVRWQKTERTLRPIHLRRRAPAPLTHTRMHVGNARMCMRVRTH